jgi:hypothetical protein
MDTSVQSVNKTWKPVVAGILDIVAGGLRILGALAILTGVMFFMPVAVTGGPGPVPDAPT